MEDDEATLVAALRRGEHAAFDAVYASWRPRVYSFLARLTGERTTAEELMQETFLRLATRARDLDPGTRLRPWLFTVARNLYVDSHRRALLDLDRFRELGLWAGRARSVAVTPFDLTEVSQTSARLECALLGLPPKLREAVLLCSVEGFEPAEAAEILGIGGASLRQRLARGRKMLREALEEAA